MQATPWLRRAIAASIALHAAIAAIGWRAMPHGAADDAPIDVELAPEAPPVEALPEEIERARHDEAPAQQVAAATAPPPRADEDGVAAPVDAAVADAPRPDAAADARRRDAATDAAKDAATDAATDAAKDAAVDAATDAAAGADSGSGAATADAMLVAAVDVGSGAVADSGSGSGSGSGPGSGSDVIAAVGSGSGSGSDAETDPAVAGAPTSAGTAANLLTYFPAGHIVTVLVRFDRLRGSEWASAAEQIFEPLPDYQALFGVGSAARLAANLDLLVISTPRPRDATATTMVAKTALSRDALRDWLGGTFAWSASRGGLLGRRIGKGPSAGRVSSPGDQRVVLSPFRGWFVLGQPADLPSLDATHADLDAVEATARLPAWLDGIRAIEAESGSDARGPALVATFAFEHARYKLPPVMDVRTVPGPVRASLAMELVPQGWLVRGNIKMGSAAEASELASAIATLQHQVASSTLLELFLRRSRALNAVTNLQVAQAGDRLSYSTSLSIADARVALAFVAQTVAAYFKPPSPPAVPP